MILLNGTEHSQLAVQEAVEHFLIHVHIRSEVFHVFIQNHSLTVHETEGNTIAGFTGTTIKGDVMVLLQSCLFNLFLKIGVISFVQNGNATLRSHTTEFIAGQHFQILVDGGNSEATVVGYLCSAAHSFFGGDFNHTGSSS